MAYLASLDHLLHAFPSIGQSIVQELKSQRSRLKMIASENFSSLSVQLAMGNLLTDKYCEGSPFKRFYSCCENVDAIEWECAETAKNYLVRKVLCSASFWSRCEFISDHVDHYTEDPEPCGSTVGI